MNWFKTFLKSSIGKKLLMSLTGLFLCTFLIAHLSGNLQLFKNDSGLSFNTYAVFMTTNPFIKFVSYGLYAIIVFHALWGLYLVFENKKARPVGYQVIDGKANSSWSSRNMGLLGSIILVFIVLHMSGFWAQYKFGTTPYVQYDKDLNTGEIFVSEYAAQLDTKMIVNKNNSIETVIVKDLYSVVQDAFKQWWVVLIYVISMIALSFHLIHGFKSAFQTVGFNHSKYNGLIHSIGIFLFGIVIPLLFAAMPVFFFIQ